VQLGLSAFPLFPDPNAIKSAITPKQTAYPSAVIRNDLKDFQRPPPSVGKPITSKIFQLPHFGVDNLPRFGKYLPHQPPNTLTGSGRNQNPGG
jgi:hypothetical protein